MAINSGPYNGLSTEEFKRRIAEDLAAGGLGRSAVNYKLRDWLFSRQHFWGEPFPILHELDAGGQPTGRIRALRPEDLPLDLPAEMAFDAKHDEPTPPLDKAPPDWLFVTLDGKRYKRETNTMPQWAGSCWYYLRFLDPTNDKALVDAEVERAWMPVDLYVGGAEHAVLHLLYARFWHKVLFDRGQVSTSEPFGRLVNQGMILGENGEKMSKARGNVVNPDEVVREYGADALRLYEMFMGPLEAVKPWSMDGVSGVRGFLDRAWRMIIDERAEAVQFNPAVADAEPTTEQNRVLHKTIKAVTADMEQLSFNTAIARLMEFVNFFLKQEVRPLSAMERFVLLLSPLAPHAAEELWAALGTRRPWPTSRGPRSMKRRSRKTPSRCPCRSTASSAAKSWLPPRPTRPPWNRPPEPNRRSPNCLPARRLSNRSSCRGGWSISLSSSSRVARPERSEGRGASGKPRPSLRLRACHPDAALGACHPTVHSLVSQ